MKKIGIQGSEASYHEMAAHQMYEDIDLMYFETFLDTFSALRDGVVDSALVAIANNAIGFISESYTELVNHADDFNIISETYLKVEHTLLAPEGSSLERITEIHSQYPALEQCRKFIELNLPEAHLVEEHDTAGSARLVSEWNDPTKAAIASTKAGKLYGLKTLQKNIQDDTTNITRFIEVVNTPVRKELPGSNKTTMLLKTPERPGALVEALLPFKERGINLSNLHSRFIPNTAFEMLFFVEFEASLWSNDSKAILKQLNTKGYETVLLGSYKQAPVPLGIK